MWYSAGPASGSGAAQRHQLEQGCAVNFEQIDQWAMGNGQWIQGETKRGQGEAIRDQMGPSEGHGVMAPQLFRGEPIIS